MLRRIGLAIWVCGWAAAAHGSLSPEKRDAFNNLEAFGTFTETLSSCSNPVDDGVKTGGAQLILRNVQPDGSFTLLAQGTGPDQDGSGQSSSASIADSGTASFSNLQISDGEGTVTTLGGNLQVLSTTVTLSTTSGSNTLGCMASVSYTGAIVARGEALEPAHAPGAPFVESTGFASSVRGTADSIAAYASAGFGGGKRAALRPSAHGIEVQSARGLSAGGVLGLPTGVWLTASYAGTEDDFAATAFDAGRYLVLGGVDVAPTESLVLGLAVGFEQTDSDTRFNRGEVDQTGFTAAPYAAVGTDRYSLDLSIGFSSIDVDQFRTDPTTGGRVSSETDTRRIFVSANGTYFRTIGSWLLSGRTGFLWAISDTDRFTESNGRQVAATSFNVFQLRVGGEAAYAAGGLEPFARATLEWDASETSLRTIGAQPPDDDLGVLVGLGVRYFADSGLSGSLEYTAVTLREHFTEHAFNALLRLEF